MRAQRTAPGGRQTRPDSTLAPFSPQRTPSLHSRGSSSSARGIGARRAAAMTQRPQTSSLSLVLRQRRKMRGRRLRRATRVTAPRGRLAARQAQRLRSSTQRSPPSAGQRTSSASSPTCPIRSAAASSGLTPSGAWPSRTSNGLQLLPSSRNRATRTTRSQRDRRTAKSTRSKRSATSKRSRRKVEKARRSPGLANGKTNKRKPRVPSLIDQQWSREAVLALL
mmetsp:Transcript_6700/g.16128  ORF Transcript_6700/g.16128 Transcript_6700/m.16128 type:complete len:223 (-) Transcript_6700:89-757(-)